MSETGRELSRGGLIAELHEALALMNALTPFVHRHPLVDNDEHPELRAVFNLTLGHARKIAGQIVDVVVAAAESAP